MVYWDVFKTYYLSFTFARNRVLHILVVISNYTLVVEFIGRGADKVVNIWYILSTYNDQWSCTFLAYATISQVQVLVLVW